MVPLHSAVQLKQCRAGPNPSWGGGYYFLPGSFCSEVSGPPEQDDCCISGLAQHQIPVATCSVLYPKPLSPVSPQVSLVHSAQLLPLFYCLWLSCLVVYLVTRSQPSGLSTKGPGQRPSWHSSYCLPSGYSCSEGRGLPKHKGCCHLRDDSALGSRWLLSVFSPRLLSPISPQVPPAHSALTFGRAQGKCLQMKICFLAL